MPISVFCPEACSSQGRGPNLSSTSNHPKSCRQEKYNCFKISTEKGLSCLFGPAAFQVPSSWSNFPGEISIIPKYFVQYKQQHPRPDQSSAVFPVPRLKITTKDTVHMCNQSQETQGTSKRNGAKTSGLSVTEDITMVGGFAPPLRHFQITTHTVSIDICSTNRQLHNPHSKKGRGQSQFYIDLRDIDSVTMHSPKQCRDGSNL